MIAAREKSGRHRVRRHCYAAYGLVIESHVRFPELVVLPRCRRIEVVVEPASRPHASRQRWLHHWTRNYRRVMSLARCDGGYLVRFHALGDFEISPDGAAVRFSASSVRSATLRHLLLDQVLPLAIGRQGRLVLHGSAVHVPGHGALAFVGPAGAGKSTLAAAMTRAGCEVLCDDACVLVDTTTGLSVAPAYAGLRLWPDVASAVGLARGLGGRVSHYSGKRRTRTNRVSFRNRPSPLRAIFLLRAGPSDGSPIRRRSLRRPDGLIALMRYTFLLDHHDPVQLAGVFGRLSDIVTAVPVDVLRVRRDADRLGETAIALLEQTAGAKAG